MSDPGQMQGYELIGRLITWGCVLFFAAITWLIAFRLTTPKKQDSQENSISERDRTPNEKRGRKRIEFGVTALLVAITIAAAVTAVVMSVRRMHPAAPVVKELNLDAKR